ncbi:MFS transporter, partial [Rubrivirga sp.]|uniref:MFS transporter n=1 Tax=Rubrivirga sp. TaxID=1885344 RepID=UPI003C7065BA
MSSATPSRFVRTFPVYFGWPVTVAAAVAMACTLPGQTAGVSLFIDSFIDDLEVSRSAVALAYTGATVGSALVLPWVGRALDRWGPRRGVVVIAALFAVACVAMGQARGLATLAVGFFLLRALGQGALSLAAVHVVNLWFVKRRGVAVGVMGLGMAAAITFVPGLIERGIGTVGWRETYAWLGVAVAVVLLPVGATFFRRHPESYGLLPDGLTGDDAPPERSVALEDARRTGTFWLLTAGLASTSCIGTALLFHHVDVMGAGGLSRADAALLFVPYGVVTAASSLGAGAVLDQIGPGRVLGVSLALFASMTASVPLVDSTAGVWAYGVVFGLVQGAQGNVGGSAYAFFFGRRHIGAIKGFTRTVFVAATAVGPPLVAWGAATLGYG